METPWNLHGTFWNITKLYIGVIMAEQWKLAFKAGRKHFELPDILPEQQKSIEAFIKG